jgi:hypothetical protein
LPDAARADAQARIKTRVSRDFFGNTRGQGKRVSAGLPAIAGAWLAV